MAADNPYQPPVFADGGMQSTNLSEVDFRVSPEDLKKAEALINEGEQFWVAIVATIFNPLLGILLLGPRNFFLYLQWQTLAARYPVLTASDSVRGSLPDKFLKAKLKLQICMSIGVVLLLLILLFVRYFFLTTMMPD